MKHIDSFLWEQGSRFLSEGDGDGEHGTGHEFGVHIVPEDLYKTVVFLFAIYVSGQIASRFLKMPDLVGEIICGIVLGPELLNFVANPEGWVMFGELG